MSWDQVLDVLRSLGIGAAFYVAVRVDLKWLRADQKRADHAIRDHDLRLRKLENQR